MTKIYLAFYKGRGKTWRERLIDWAIRTFTKGQYSHCEIAIKRSEFLGHYHLNEWFECYSASPRDGGVRRKNINVADREKWDLVPIEGVLESQIQLYFQLTQGKKYDWYGAIGLVLGMKQNKERFFCSEWCFNALKVGSDDGWRFSPNQLAVMARGKMM